MTALPPLPSSASGNPLSNTHAVGLQAIAPSPREWGTSEHGSETQLSWCSRERVLTPRDGGAGPSAKRTLPEFVPQSAAASVVLRAVDLESTASVRFGLVHRRIGPRDYRFVGVGGIGKHGDSYARPDREAEAANGKRFVQCRYDSLSDDLGFPAGRGTLSNDSEFVAADPGDGVYIAHGCEQSLRDGAEQLITDFVPMGIIDDLEPVQVDEEHGDATATPACDGQGLGHSIFEESGVGKLGDRVMQSLVAHLVKQRHAVKGSCRQAGHTVQALSQGVIGLETVAI